MRLNRLSEEQLRNVVLARRMARLLRCAGPCNGSRLSDLAHARVDRFHPDFVQTKQVGCIFRKC